VEEDEERGSRRMMLDFSFQNRSAIFICKMLSDLDLKNGSQLFFFYALGGFCPRRVGSPRLRQLRITGRGKSEEIMDHLRRASISMCLRPPWGLVEQEGGLGQWKIKKLGMRDHSPSPFIEEPFGFFSSIRF
jgi:hypothetical protein